MLARPLTGLTIALRRTLFNQEGKVMANSKLLLVAAMAAAACSAGAAAQAQSSQADTATVSTGVPVYQGVAFVTAYTDATADACENAGFAVGSYDTMIYRQLVESGNTSYGGGFGFANERDGFSFVMPAGKPLNSGTQKLTTASFYGESSQVGPYSYTGAFDLKISSPGSATKPKASVTISGTVTNYYGTTGCDVTINAALTLRP
jgi:hypothetical protein